MEIGETLYVKDRDEWRSWLEKNFNKKKDIWLIYYKKSSGKDRISYNDAVEEALCFGWIDSIMKGIDEEKYAQRFTPRRAGSGFSQLNKERLKWLLEHDMVHPSVMEQVEEVLEEVFVFPDDIIAELNDDEEAWENFQKYSESYKRIRIAYVDSARDRPEDFRKRLDNLIKVCRQGKQIGFDIEKYY